MQGFIADRVVLRLSGADHYRFLQDLVSNDLERLSDGAVYAALLTPQGKYLFDFFVISEGDALLVDVKAERAQALAQRLAMYRLRAKVEIAATDLQVAQVFGPKPEGLAVADPRGAELGWRVYGTGLAVEGAEEAWTRLRIAHGVPETGAELVADQSYILEMDFERLNGVDFKKGCYVGQEVTARMKHKTELKKGLARVAVEGAAEPGTEITADGKPAGMLHTVLDGEGLAYLRFDRAKGAMQAGEAVVRRL
ncbi:MAG: folate-binding protein [Pseudomonadota bacterium]